MTAGGRNIIGCEVNRKGALFMYCIHCGVKLQENAAECPLCHTPVVTTPMPASEVRSRYSDRYPETEKHHGKFLVIWLLTALMIVGGLTCLIYCVRAYGTADWSGYVLLSLALLWVCLILPWMFPRWKPMIFLPVDFACTAAFLLYICAKTGGNWFLGFAFPVTGIAAVMTLIGVALMRYITQGRLRLMSLLVIAIGLSFMLIEFFAHITFGQPMFVWSLYCVCAFCLLGLFLFIASLIPPLSAALRRKFFF